MTDTQKAYFAHRLSSSPFDGLRDCAYVAECLEFLLCEGKGLEHFDPETNHAQTGLTIILSSISSGIHAAVDELEAVRKEAQSNTYPQVPDSTETEQAASCA